MAKRKEYTIEAKGLYFTKYKEYSEDIGKIQATKAVLDMLRYDHGKVVHMDIVKETRSFTAIIKCTSYTKGRWDSFSIRTREVNYDSYMNGVA